MDKLIENISAALLKAKDIIIKPKEELEKVRDEEWSVSAILKEYVAILAGIAAVAWFIGHALVGQQLVGRLPIGRSLLFMLLSFVLNIVAVVVVGKVIDALAPNFNAIRNDSNAFKLSVYSMTPLLVAGIFNIVPSLNILSLLGSLYGIYVLYLGLPILMEAPEQKSVAYLIVSLVVVILIMSVIGFVAAALAFGGTIGSMAF